MPRKCCVPGCKSNYRSSLRGGIHQCVTTFSFPKNDVRRSQWIRAIPRKNWTPSVSAVVCCKHFSDSDIIRFDKHLQPDGSFKQLLLKHPRLKETAVPSIFPNLPSYLSAEKEIQKRTDPQKRRENIFEAHAKLVDNFLKQDFIKTFEHLKNDYMQKVNIFNWEVKILTNKLYFYILKEDGNFLSIESNIVVDDNLTAHVFLKNHELSPSDLHWILPIDLKLSRWSQLSNLLSRYKNISDTELKQPDVVDLLKKSLVFLEEANKITDNVDFAYTKELEIVTDQIKQLVSSTRNYSSSTIIFAFMIYCQSPACYNLIRDFLLLPTKRHLQNISSTLNISPGVDANNNNYLNNVAKCLSESDKVVLLLIDEIYLSSRLDYRAQSIVGSASNKNDIAKTALTFMISSAFGSMKEVVKILPVNNINGREMVPITLNIINFIQSSGFEVLGIITDNHSINRVMFNNMASESNKFPNPKYPEKTIFVLYDFVHIFKNIWKNWMNLKNLDQTFVYYDFYDDFLRYAKFQDIRDVYHSEKNQIIKQAYKLNFKSVYPSVLERQKVNLADNVFHQSTVACLKSNSKYQDTGEFLAVIRKWWDIVNNRSTQKGNIKRNEWCLPIESSSDLRVTFLKEFISWLDKWNQIENNNGHLSSPTFHALRHSTMTLIDMIEYCFVNYKIKYFLAGKFTTENLEKRFGVYRILAGCNYNVSLDDIMGAEKKIRVKQIFKRIKGTFSIAELRSQFSIDATDCAYELLNSDTTEIDLFLNVLATNYLEEVNIDDATKIYVCGYVAHTVARKLNCETCISLVTLTKGTYENNEYFDNLQRGGLSVGTDYVNFIFFHMYSLLCRIISDKNLEGKFLKCNNQKIILIKLTIESIKSDFFYTVFEKKCICGNNYQEILNMICSVLSNIMLNNYVKNKNNQINESLHCKRKKTDNQLEKNSIQVRKLHTFKK